MNIRKLCYCCATVKEAKEGDVKNVAKDAFGIGMQVVTLILLLLLGNQPMITSNHKFPTMIPPGSQVVS